MKRSDNKKKADRSKNLIQSDHDSDESEAQVDEGDKVSMSSTKIEVILMSGLL